MRQCGGSQASRGLQRREKRWVWAVWVGKFGLTYKERFIIRLPPEQVKCESLQPLRLDLFQPNGLEHLGGFKAVLRVGGRIDALPHPSPRASAGEERVLGSLRAYLEDTRTAQLV